MKKIIFFTLLSFWTIHVFAAEKPFLKLENRVVDYFDDTNLNRIFNMNFGNLPIENMKNLNIEWDRYEKDGDIKLEEVSSAGILIYSHNYSKKLHYPKGFLRRIEKDGWIILDQDEDEDSNTVLLRQQSRKDNTYLACLILTEEKLILLEVVGKESK